MQLLKSKFHENEVKRKWPIGTTFNRLTIVGHELVEFENGTRGWNVKCLCACGNEYSCKPGYLKNERIKSCGCLRRQTSAETVADPIKNRNRLKELRAKCTKPEGEAAFNSLFSGYKKGASKRGFSFELSREQFSELIKQNCKYCGITPSAKWMREYMNGSCTYNGIDRVDSSKGYLVGNVVPCCAVCNMAKGKLSKDQFISWITRVARHLGI